MLRHDLSCLLSLERPLSRHHLEQHGAEGVQVRTPVHLLAERLLRAHVVRLARRQRPLGEPLSRCLPHGPGDPEIGDHRLAFLQQDVLGPDVAVQDPLAVRVVERRCHLAADLQYLLGREPDLTVQPIAQRLALREGHHVVEQTACLPTRGRRNDVGMSQPRRPYLLEKPLGIEGGRQIGTDDLEDDATVELQIVGETRNRHPAATHLMFDAVAVCEGGFDAVQQVGHWAVSRGSGSR